MKADYAPAAEHDLEQAVDSFLLVSTSAATDFGNLVDASVAALLEFPELGRRGPGGKRTLVLSAASEAIAGPKPSDAGLAYRPLHRQKREARDVRAIENHEPYCANGGPLGA